MPWVALGIHKTGRSVASPSAQQQQARARSLLQCKCRWTHGCQRLSTVAFAMQMLRSEDSGVHYEAVGVLGNLVHSSQEIKQQVLQVRARNHGAGAAGAGSHHLVHSKKPGS